MSVFAIHDTGDPQILGRLPSLIPATRLALPATLSIDADRKILTEH